MTIEQKFILFQIIILVPSISGALLKSRIPDVEKLAKSLISFNLIFISPVIFLWSIWGLRLTWTQIFLPISGLALAVAGFTLGKFALPFLSLDRKSSATFCITSSLANHGFTLGGFLCYLFGGIEAFGMAAIFLTYFTPFTFLFIFSFAGRASNKIGMNAGNLLTFSLNLRNMPLFAVLAAFLLKGIGIQKPSIQLPLNELMMISIAMYYFTLGINFDLKTIKSIKRENVFLAVMKFLILPALTYGALYFVDLGRGVESVILLQSFMPVAIYSVLTSVLFDLDTGMASGLFVVNDLLFLFAVLPVLFLLQGVIFF